MTNAELIYAKRILREMQTLMENAGKIQQDTGGSSVHFTEQMHFFMGLGLALAIFFEEQTGSVAIKMKPKELMEWCDNLPQPQARDKLKGGLN
jgi:hypothetical protein